MDEMERDALKQRTADLERLDRIKSEFTRTVAHELRAPIAAVQSYLRLLLDGYIAQERQNEYLNRAVDCTEAELALIGDLLDLAHLQSPDLSPKHELVDLASSLQGVCALLQSTAEEKGIQLAVSVPQQDMTISAEPKHMRQLWDNLVSNAIKYTQPGGEVDVAMTRDADRAKLTVRDTGIGMSPQELERIFEEFYRSKPAKEFASMGTGLGLAIAKRIVDTYQGRIDVHSEPGIGSTFTVSLPISS
jgi:signal transduction histidine kinase